MFRKAYPAAMQTNMPTAIGSGGSRFGSRQTQFIAGARSPLKPTVIFASPVSCRSGSTTLVGATKLMVTTKDSGGNA
jgi:hypothetical protein